MAGRYDKYEPKGGGFRAPLAANLAASATPVAVGLNSSGQVVAGAGNTGIVGVLILTLDKKAGQPVDIMTHGECVEMAGLTAGTKVTALTTTGALGTAAADATHITIGWTVEATRLIVRKGSVNV
jgi:hypothetical protein